MSRSTTSFPHTILRVKLSVVCYPFLYIPFLYVPFLHVLFLRVPFLRVQFLYIASFSHRLPALSLFPSFLPIANLIEGFVISTGQLLCRGRALPVVVYRQGSCRLSKARQLGL